MVKTLTTSLIGLGLALTMACSSSSDEAAEAPAASEAPNLADIHADDAGEKIPVTMENYEVAESDLAFYNITKLEELQDFRLPEMKKIS